MSDILTTIPMRVAHSNTAPRRPLPPRSCDAHFHVFEPGYPHVPNPHYTFPNATLAQYLDVCDYLGIERMVLVQPSFYGTDNTLLLRALDRLGERGRGVVMIDASVSAIDLDRMAERGVCAIRLDLFSRAAWPRADLRAYISDVLALIRGRGWHLQLYAPGYVLRDLLPFLATVENDFVIDHMGYMLERDGLSEHDFANLLGALQTGFAWIKLSGPYRLVGSGGYEAVARVAQELVATRADRILWGSDWPHLPDGSRDTGNILNLLFDWVPDEAVRHAILVDNPRRVFHFT